jgi:hypothetical protein
MDMVHHGVGTRTPRTQAEKIGVDAANFDDGVPFNPVTGLPSSVDTGLAKDEPPSVSDAPAIPETKPFALTGGK